MKRIEKHEHDNTILRYKVKELTKAIERAENARKRTVSRLRASSALKSPTPLAPDTSPAR